jgi:hypothetical protein
MIVLLSVRFGFSVGLGSALVCLAKRIRGTTSDNTATLQSDVTPVTILFMFPVEMFDGLSSLPAGEAHRWRNPNAFRQAG